MKRKTPIRHRVRRHTRGGRQVKSFERGTGSLKRRSSKTVGKSTNSAKKYPWTECQLKHPSVKKKILICIEQIEGKTGDDDPFKICQASIPCPPKVPDLPNEDIELMRHLINDPARRIYVHLRKDLGIDREEVLDWFEEHSQWGEIPGIVSPLGRGRLVSAKLRKLFGVRPDPYLDPDEPIVLPRGFDEEAT